MSTTAVTTGMARSLRLRAELRLALLAGAEACWIYAILYTIGTMAGFARVVSPVGIFVVYLMGLFVGRILPRSQYKWRLLQVVTVFFAVLAILVAMRVGMYGETPLFDLNWVSTYFSRTLSFFERVSPEILSTIALIFTFTRALSFAQRPLTLWVIGFQFRLGIVVFFVAAFLAALSTHANFIFWIFVFFALSLAGIALARIEEAGQERPLGFKWALVLAAALAVALLCGFILTQFLTLDTVNAFFGLLSPLWVIAEILLSIIVIPLFFLLDILLRFLQPVFELLRQAMAGILPPLNANNEEALRVVNEVTRQIGNFMPYLRLLAIIGVLLFLGWLIARALNRRLKWAEEEMFVRERMDDDEDGGLEQQRRPRAERPPRREIHAENVRRIYAALLAQAETLNLKRRDAETPLEFLPRLAGRFPESAVEMQTITDAYVAVHYAQQPATDNQVKELRHVWQRTREQMRDEGRRSTKDGGRTTDDERRRA